MTDFSQSGEQAMILEWAERHGPGRFLDIGAADGLAASNTRALALAGWHGVCVEPAARMFDKLVGAYRDIPEVECVQAVVAHQLATSLVPFYYSHDLVSTTEQKNADTWAELVDFRRCHVAAVSVLELLHVFPGPYDFASVDTEGTSVELWDELRALNAFVPGAFAVIEAEDGGERWEIQQACLEGWARVGVTENNVLLERL
jgi:FkbM family methyltransferase